MRLIDWLDDQRRSAAWLAREMTRRGLPTGVRSIQRWIAGDTQPSAADALAIEEITEGAVTAADIVNKPTGRRRPGRPVRRILA